MDQIYREIDILYESCGIDSNSDYQVSSGLNAGRLNNILYSDKEAFSRNSAFSYAACGASSVGFDWLNDNSSPTSV